jgi:threonine/homoserine/homoserine lactone efflux protein
MIAVIPFAIATLGESLNPGPTLMVLLSARIHSRRAAWGVVMGVALANIAWVAIVLLLRPFAGQLSPLAEPIFKAVAALFLTLVASRVTVGAVIGAVEAYFLGNSKMPPKADRVFGARPFFAGAVGGFSVHFINPLSFSYYLGAYSGTLAINPSLALLFAAIAVLIDLVVYGIIAYLPGAWFATPSRFAVATQRIIALIAGLAMLFLVANIVAIDKGQQVPAWWHALRDLSMSLGLLFGTFWGAEDFAKSYGGQKNKLLWRGVLVWQSALGAIAIIGTILSVLVRIDPSGFGIDTSYISAVAICSLVAAVATAALSYARARGELLDESQPAAGDAVSPDMARARSFNGPFVVFAILVLSLALLFASFVFSGFSK